MVFLMNDMSQLLIFGTRRSLHIQGIRRAVKAGKTVIDAPLNQLSILRLLRAGLTPVARAAGRNIACPVWKIYMELHCQPPMSAFTSGIFDFSGFPLPKGSS